MIRIDGAVGPSFQPQQPIVQQQGQVIPANVTTELVAAELAEASAGGLSETMENLSLGVGNNLKRLMQNSNAEDPQLKSLEKLMAKMDQAQATMVNQLAAELATKGSGEQILQQIAQMGLDKGQVMLLLMSLTMSGKLAEYEMKKLRKALQEMLATEGAELAVFAAMESLPLDEAGLAALRQMYQQAQRGEAGLIKWFESLKEFPDRRRRIRVLLLALSEPLSDHNTGHDMVKLAAVIDDLRRLLIFLTIEQHSSILAKPFKLQSDQVLELTLKLLEQSWVYPQWVDAALGELALADGKKLDFLRRWRGLVSMIHENCFRDEEQKQRIEEVLLEVLDIMGEQE